MNNRKEFLEKLEKFKSEYPEILLGGVDDQSGEILYARPKGSSKRETDTQACANGDTWYDKDLYNCSGQDGDCDVDSRSDMDCLSTGGGSGQTSFDQTCV